MVAETHAMHQPAKTKRTSCVVEEFPKAAARTARMTRLRKESHARMLGNGMCTRPVELECRMESACETCAYYRTGPEFVPVLLRQRDHARKNGQTDRAELFDSLVANVIGAPT